MKLELLKKGQGLYARRIAYAMGTLLVAFGAYRLFGFINKPKEGILVADLPVIGDLSSYKLIALGVFFVGMLVLHLFLNRESNVNLLIDTEKEMKNVSWPSKREVKSASIVVVIVTLVLMLLLFGFDWILQRLFSLVIGS